MRTRSRRTGRRHRSCTERSSVRGDANGASDLLLRNLHDLEVNEIILLGTVRVVLEQDALRLLVLPVPHKVARGLGEPMELVSACTMGMLQDCEPGKNSHLKCRGDRLKQCGKSPGPAGCEVESAEGDPCLK